LPLLPNRHRTIVTSRHRLAGLDDAHHLVLSVLPISEAAEIVGDAELAELCGRLPLALRIMAALRGSDPDHDWVAELREAKLDLLDDGDERSVRAAFELSYRALTEEQRRLFRLAVLHPSNEVTVEGAAQLTECSEAQARKLLRDLRTAHLLEPGDRYHDLVRQFAADCVREDEQQDTRQRAMSRLITHFTARAEEMDAALQTPPRAETLRWFDLHRPTLISLVASALLFNHVAEARRLAWALHDYLSIRDRPNDQLLMAQVAVDAAVYHGNSWDVVVAQVELGRICLRAGDDKRALSALESAWRMVQVSFHLPLMHYTLEGLVIALERNGRPDDAEKAAVNRDEVARLLKTDSR
jgi:hypothetical protein